MWFWTVIPVSIGAGGLHEAFSEEAKRKASNILLTIVHSLDWRDDIKKKTLHASLRFVQHKEIPLNIEFLKLQIKQEN